MCQVLVRSRVPYMMILTVFFWVCVNMFCSVFLCSVFVPSLSFLFYDTPNAYCCTRGNNDFVFHKHRRFPHMERESSPIRFVNAWWRHQMAIFSALLAICAGNSLVHGEFPAQRPATRNFDVYFDMHPNNRLSRQSWGWWFETQSGPLWRHRNGHSNTNISFSNIFISKFHIADDTWLIFGWFLGKETNPVDAVRFHVIDCSTLLAWRH